MNEYIPAIVVSDASTLGANMPLNQKPSPCWTLKIQPADAKDYIDWIKLQLTICSAAIGGLLYKFDVTPPIHIKVAAYLFVVSMMAHLASYAALVEHKNAQTADMSILASLWIYSGWITFLAGFFTLAANIS